MREITKCAQRERARYAGDSNIAIGRAENCSLMRFLRFKLVLISTNVFF
jgi:hypothetical protein